MDIRWELHHHVIMLNRFLVDQIKHFLAGGYCEGYATYS